MDILRQDLRSAARALRHSRGFVAAVVLVTALGVGANTATFSVADFVLLRPLPFPEPSTLVRLCEGPREGGGWPLSASHNRMVLSRDAVASRRPSGLNFTSST